MRRRCALTNFGDKNEWGSVSGRDLHIEAPSPTDVGGEKPPDERPQRLPDGEAAHADSNNECSFAQWDGSCCHGGGSRDDSRAPNSGDGATYDQDCRGLSRGGY